MPKDPRWLEIATRLRDQIMSEELAVGDKIPGENDLARDYGVSRTTVRQAIESLGNLVERRPGQGTFVIKIEPLVTTLSGDSKPDKGLSGGGEGQAIFEEARIRRPQDKLAGRLTVEPKFADSLVARLLDVPKGTSLILRQVRRYSDDRPWSLEKSYYPQEYFTRGAADLQQKTDIAGGTVAYLNRTLGRGQVGYRDQIVVRPPNDDEANFFRLPINGTVSVTLIIRIGYADGPVRPGHTGSTKKPLPFRVTVNTYPADRHQFVINYGRVGEAIADPIDLIESSAYDSSGST